eukprot:365756-Chlamydomonas_euryale.AAC.4
MRPRSPQPTRGQQHHRFWRVEEGRLKRVGERAGQQVRDHAAPTARFCRTVLNVACGEAEARHLAFHEAAGVRV